eukprot:2959652-Amphidinium_carterae.1
MKVERKELSKNKARKKRVREGRPSLAIGRIEFEFKQNDEGGDDCEAKWIADQKSYSISEWIGMGTCRRDPHNPPDLTPWQLGPDVL